MPGAKVTGPTGVVVNTVQVVNSTTLIAQMSVSANAPMGANKAVTVTNPLAGGYGYFQFKGATIAP